MWKFEIGEKIIVVNSEVTGTVLQMRNNHFVCKDFETHDREYYIQLAEHKRMWYKEKMIDNLDKDIVRKLISHSLEKAEPFLKQNQIDHMLDNRNFDGLKDLT
ncbi:hypothetical protein P4V41_07830 [Fictibacillus nanhaiensis]|uniref:hypothetical protein n=1 Tax=Fictibacillus nanhaiensis TaxID=742169 RepID=UPI002E20BE96|nr:hypothetical protein [Fictibacillus nanhaiensis]